MIHCHFCGANAVSQHSSTETYQYTQQAYNVLLDYSVCNQCGEEIITTEQIHANEARVREAKKKLDGLLSCEEIRAIRIRLKLTQEEAAKVFGGGVNAFSKYERGEVTQSAAMDKLIRLTAENQSVLTRLKAMADLTDSAAEVINLKIEREKPTFHVFSSKAHTADFSSNDNVYAINTSKKLSVFTLPNIKMA